ncbi:hypothetical protein K435DRAFT_570518, partial [Dendrothele bispora CBS 962.96]
KKIHWSAPLRTELKAHCKKVDIQYKTIKRIVKTRWNTYAVMLESVLHLRPALQRLCDHHSDLATITRSEWDLIDGLHKILNPFIWFTKEMEGNQRPLIHEVIPLMDMINRKLEAVVDNDFQDNLLRIAAKKGLMVLDKYYAKTDDSLIY